MSTLIFFVIAIIVCVFIAIANSANETEKEQAIEARRIGLEEWAEEVNSLPAPEDGLGKPCPFIEFKTCSGECVHYQKQRRSIEWNGVGYDGNEHPAYCKLWDKTEG